MGGKIYDHLLKIYYLLFESIQSSYYEAHKFWFFIQKLNLYDQLGVQYTILNSRSLTFSRKIVYFTYDPIQESFHSYFVSLFFEPFKKYSQFVLWLYLKLWPPNSKFKITRTNLDFNNKSLLSSINGQNI